MFLSKVDLIQSRCMGEGNSCRFGKALFDKMLTTVGRASQKIDYELELGYFVSKPVGYGARMSIKDAPEHIFGFVLLNDWSARDHQLFEMRYVYSWPFMVMS